MASGDQKIAKIQTHFQTLSSEAKSLNAASDELTKVVGILDDALRKLNVGLAVWLTYSRWSDGVNDGEDQVGYCKVNGKWGIAILRINNYDQSEEGPWLFNDAPRDFRIMAVDKIPDVIEKLGQTASAITKTIQAKTQEVRYVANAVTQIVNESKIPTFSERVSTHVQNQQKPQIGRDLGNALTTIANDPGTRTLSERIAAGERLLVSEATRKGRLKPTKDGGE